MITSDNLFSKVSAKDAAVAHQRSERIEDKKNSSLKRLKKKKQSQDQEEASFASKLIAPVLLLITALISYLVWLASGQLTQ